MNKTGREERAVILDFLPNGYPADTRPAHMKTAIAQAIGTNHFIILELVPKKGVFLKPNQEVYMGEGKREEIHHISGRIPFYKLTQTAKMSIEPIIKKFMHVHQEKFMEFFNKAGPINTRRHQLELIPGIGKKHMWEIIEKRKEKPFENFEDMKNRVKLLPDPEKAVIKRILSELQEDDKYRIFVGS